MATMLVCKSCMQVVPTDHLCPVEMKAVITQLKARVEELEGPKQCGHWQPLMSSSVIGMPGPCSKKPGWCHKTGPCTWESDVQ